MWYVAQVIPQIDAEIAEKGHFWMETRIATFLMMVYLSAESGVER